MNDLTGQQFETLQAALLSVFTDRFELEKMVRFALEKNLNTIAGGENLDQITFRLITWSETYGKLPELILAAQKENPKRIEQTGLLLELGLSETVQINEERAQTLGGMAKPNQRSHPPTINHDEPVELFHQLLNPATTHRYMRLLGGPEMGKSHLLTRVLPVIAFQNGWRPILLDLRNQATTIIGSLDFLCQTIGRPNFPEYERALQAWTSQPQVQGDTIEALLATFAIGRSRLGKEQNEQTQRIEYELTTCVVNDLAKLNHVPLVLIFDQVENASVDVQRWLMEHLLADLKSVEHICVVAGGRTLPEAARSYQFLCCSHELEPVTQPAAYISYCREIAVELSEQSIKDIANLVQYIPGQFANLVRNSAEALS